MPQVLPSELNGHWFKMKSEKRCEVNEFHTPVSLKTRFWLSSHSDWGWHVGNCAMLILHSKKVYCSVMHTHTCLNSLSRDFHELRHCAFIFSLCPLSVVGLNALSYLTHWLLIITPEITGLTLINTIFFTRTAGQCWQRLYFCCRNWAISGSGDETWAIWYKLVKVTTRSSLVLTLVNVASHK